jgi:uncharacterized protein
MDETITTSAGACCSAGQAGYRRFGLTLTLTTSCNLRCSYCYIGKDSPRTMDAALGRHAIDRAIDSTQPGGCLELEFFGGEPLLAAGLLLQLAQYARDCTTQTGRSLKMQVTTNGTADTPAAWEVMLAPDIRIAVSCDGAAHDRHRRTAGGQPTLATVLDTIGRLVAAGKDPCVICVVGPDSAGELTDSMRMLLQAGVQFAHPSLDLWAKWTARDVEVLAGSLRDCADLWRDNKATFSIGWFDTIAAGMAGLVTEDCARCSFGAGQVAVAPSGNLYPCERLIEDDRMDNPQRLGGHAMDDGDFLAYRPQPARSLEACDECTIRDFCMTYCRCSNYVRTGDVARPDGLLCRLNRICFDEVSRVLLGSNSKEGTASGNQAV